MHKCKKGMTNFILIKPGLIDLGWKNISLVNFFWEILSIQFIIMVNGLQSFNFVGVLLLRISESGAHFFLMSWTQIELG